MRKSIILFVLLSYNIVIAQVYQLNQDKILADKEQLLGYIKKEFKNPLSVSFSLSNLLTFEEKIKIKDDNFFNQLKDSIQKDPQNIDMLITMATYCRETGDKKTSKHYFEESMKLLQTKSTIQDSMAHYLKLCAVKDELNHDFYKEIKILMDLGASTIIEKGNKYNLFLFMALMYHKKFDSIKRDAIYLLDSKAENPEYVYLFLLISLFYETFDKPKEIDFGLLDKYSKLYRDNKGIQDIRKLANLLPLFIKFNSFEFDRSKLFFPFSKKEYRDLDNIKKWLENTTVKKRFSSFSTHKYLGLIYFLKNDRKKAIYHYQKSIASLPEEQKSIKNLEEIYDQLFTLYSVEKDDENSKKITQQRIELVKGHDKLIAVEYHKLALMYFEKENFEESYYWCSKARDKDLTNPDVLLLMAYFEFKKGMQTLALEYYMQKAIENADSQAKAYTVSLQLGIYSMITGDLDTAMQMFSQATEYTENTEEKEYIQALIKKYFIAIQ